MYQYFTGNLDFIGDGIVNNQKYIYTSLIVLVVILLNKDYLKDNIQIVIKIFISYAVLGVCPYIETELWILNIIILAIIIGIAIGVYKFATIDLKDKLGINPLFSYALLAGYGFSMLMINDTIIIYTIANTLLTIFALSYTTYIPGNFKIDIHKIKEKKKFNGVSDYLLKHSNKVSPYVVIAFVLGYFFINFFVFYREVSILVLLFLISFVFLTILVFSKYNSFSLISYKEEIK